ncbi:hypothetical protein SAMN04487898_1228 [Pedobacter sp. ok626]|uniref:hypothetical protein n=1 Tax=Pedobacter sp. ok626 TaxID=1761882 RepID=UPI0008800B09|nr:hypothetical protein [Pedobacter sp. ok626]SDL64352.1 hypothetical protein SAMN04487898_1228 [Pedobacter sp. ok626]
MKKLCAALLFSFIGISAFASDLTPKVKGATLEVKTTLKKDKIEVSTAKEAVGKLKRVQVRVDWMDECGNTMAIYVSAPQGTPYGDYWMAAANHAINIMNNNGGCLY